ncbi:16S rRNA (cytidine(1402)-2'-O)-methyltransferase [Sulfobacillus harzensis]|uniref:Ribosomal RNA small subunit methyltransferase I n=1 Tax=Sulfobacillus harzensis TaxID=2729629 RepID=A0A7Y0Q3G6_9FIRM|nr:16S rRNA (cytidine(1402)-2'-O)-methyltransferase [Sulfobacillus harzensis]NMP23375.1 16S rRNA (cytidine(1402)-2'-O)-methyltransferase [Sulfobacillus harzensis]
MTRDSLSPACLYVVGTPIGNLQDWSPRAQKVLQECDVVLAEDTRVTGLLLHHAGIKKPMVSFHAHNTQERIPDLIRRLQAGDRVALVTDRGMPAISDPGQELVDAVWEARLQVSVIPGPSAGITAFAASGFPAPYAFWGFLPRSGPDRRAVLEEIAQWPHASVLYEAPHHMAETLEDLTKTLGSDRTALVGREMTKKFEEFWRGPLAELRDQDRAWRGECVLVVGPLKKMPGSGEVEWPQLISRVRQLVSDGLHPNEAIRQVARQYGVLRRELYQRVHDSG